MRKIRENDYHCILSAYVLSLENKDTQRFTENREHLLSIIVIFVFPHYVKYMKLQSIRKGRKRRKEWVKLFCTVYNWMPEHKKETFSYCRDKRNSGKLSIYPFRVSNGLLFCISCRSGGFSANLPWPAVTSQQFWFWKLPHDYICA